MERDLELERKILLQIEKVYRPGQGFVLNLEIKGHYAAEIAEHCKLLYQQNLIGDYRDITIKEEDYDFRVGNLTAFGYNYLEMIKDENTWRKSLKKVEEKELPKTIENIAKIIGIITGNTIKEMSGIP